MPDPSPTDNTTAQAALNELKERTAALRKEAFERSANDTFTMAFGQQMSTELADLNASLSRIRKTFAPSIEEVAPLLSGRLLTVGDYKQFMPKLNIELAPEGALPFDIVDILNRQSPVHEDGVLVKDRHLLAWIPDNISLNDLSQALGGQDGGVLRSDWFIKESDPLGALKLSDVGRGGHWALIPDRFPAGTELNGFDDSVAALQSAYGENYQQPDVISFTSALLLHTVKNQGRWYSDTWAWCKDPRAGTPLYDESSYGGGRSRALDVGGFQASGLSVFRVDPDCLLCYRGCAAVWNFDNGSQKL